MWIVQSTICYMQNAEYTWEIKRHKVLCDSLFFFFGVIGTIQKNIEKRLEQLKSRETIE